MYEQELYRILPGYIKPKVLKRMNRTYTRERFYDMAMKIREIMPNCGLSTDIIGGKLIIKEYPTASAHSGHFNSWLSRC